jgi:hypothetical protein
MKTNGKVQTNGNKVNVLVETNNSDNKHCSSLNRRINVTKVLTDQEIIELWKNRKVDDELELAKNWIKKQEGYAVCNCVDDTLNITYNSIVEYG